MPLLNDNMMPDYAEQIRRTHAELIHLVVQACMNRELKSQLEPVLQSASAGGWESLTKVIYKILDGNRDESLTNGLDREDGVIIHAILEGLQNPTTLPDIQQQAEPAMAAPGLAHMIHAASRGDAQALQSVSFMAEQMVRATGDLKALGGLMHRLINGERDPDVLRKGLSATGEQLLLSILEELNKFNIQ